jgi:hypothetical protein
MNAACGAKDAAVPPLYLYRFIEKRELSASFGFPVAGTGVGA